MARAQLRARFFVAPNGVVIPKAPTLTTKQRRAIHDRDAGRCQLCGAPVAWHRVPFYDRSDLRTGAVDHVLPRARGGQNDPTNLRLTCETCNAARGAY
jgi:5-methylcytosine-specific restriction endonuclease McrA